MPRTTRTPCLQDPTALVSLGTSKGFPSGATRFIVVCASKTSRTIQFVNYLTLT